MFKYPMYFQAESLTQSGVQKTILTVDLDETKKPIMKKMKLVVSKSLKSWSKQTGLEHCFGLFEVYYF